MKTFTALAVLAATARSACAHDGDHYSKHTTILDFATPKM